MAEAYLPPARCDDTWRNYLGYGMPYAYVHVHNINHDLGAFIRDTQDIL